jgi:hypothetical protein
MSEDTIDYVVSEADLYEVYSLLADATDAAAAGEPNECASKAADAKEQLMAVHEDGRLLSEVSDE